MGSKDLLKSSLTRRTFVKGMAAVGAAATVAGCSSDDGGALTVSGAGGNLAGSVAPTDLSNAKIYYAGCTHNCGTGVRCVSKLHVVNGIVKRITTDESEVAYDGTARNKEDYNDSRSITCPKGRALKFKAHHPGRLRYALKQTKTRGDMSGFIRIPMQQAMDEIAKKYRAIQAKYGSTAIHSIYATSGGYDGVGGFSNYGDTRTALYAPAGSRTFYSDYSYHQYHYGQPLVGHPGSGGAYSNPSNVLWQIPAIIGVVQNVVSWGSNILSTNNAAAYGYIRGMEELRKRGGKAWFIGPELSDTGVTCHTDWVQLRNYTDTALIMGMIYHMIVNTFNPDGSLMDNPMLDVDYLDTMVYGFFDSPAYWLVKQIPTKYLGGTNTDITGEVNLPASSLVLGTISENEPTTMSGSWNMETGFWYWDKSNPGAVSTDKDAYDALSSTAKGNTTSVTTRWENRSTPSLYAYSIPYETVEHIEAVPAGKSLSAYVMGDDDRLTKAQYSAGNNYTAQQFAARHSTRNAAKCSYTAKEGANTKYLYKQAFNKAKTPQWASDITGTPVAQIEALAKMYCDPAQHPIFNEWCGGVQKQGNGVVNIWAITVLMAVTKTFGLPGETFSGPWRSRHSFAPVGDLNADNFINTASPAKSVSGNLADNRKVSISCKEWFNGIKLAFHDELKNKEYKATHIPDWDMNATRYYFNDGGVKTGVVYERDADGKLIEETINGETTYKYVKDAQGNPIYAGTRMIISHGGGIMVNQHMNTNDTTEMYKLLPLSGGDKNADPTNPDNLCLVQMDIFMSPSARFADYVIPVAMNYEVVDNGTIGATSSNSLRQVYGRAMYRPPVVKAVGDVVDSYELTYMAYKAHSELGEYIDNGKTTTGLVNSPTTYINASTFKPVAEIYEARVDAAIANSTSKFYGMTKDQVHASVFSPAKTNEVYFVPSGTKYETKATAVAIYDVSQATADREQLSTAGQIRKNLDAYLKLDVAIRKITPFISVETDGVQNNFVASTYWGSSTGGGTQVIDEKRGARPNAAGRMQVYSGMLVHDYRNAFSKYHGWLPAEKRGQENVDAEGDPLVYPIPMYFNFEDYFNEAYGVFRGKSENDLSKKGGLTLGTTHDRYRVHSTHNENPFLRELNHRVKGGAPANDWQEYAIVPERQVVGAAAPFNNMISKAVENKDMTTASWHEIWMNTEDARERGIAHGDLVRVENPIGKVRVIAKVTDRCVRGHVNLHQGGWYDPNTDGVDDGGCANTLIASMPSRIDHGNAQQMCYVTITKETSF